MSKSTEKLKALDLRRKGFSIKEIAKKLDVSPGSVSLWCQGIILTAPQKVVLKRKQYLAGQIGRQKGADMNRAKRVDALAQARARAEAEVREVSNRELFYLGLGIYWGEGVKSRTGQATVVNSDPRILRVMMRWFVECMKVEKGDFRPYVYISKTHRSREDIIMRYWGKVLSLPQDQFKSPIYLTQKPKQKYENHDTYYRVVALRVAKSTNLKYKILALLSVLSDRLE
jgi:transcriptional regulator with XRE-family HTH domain